MGEKIVKKIRGMSWTTKISLMLIFTLLAGVLYYGYVNALNQTANFSFETAGGSADLAQNWTEGGTTAATENTFQRNTVAGTGADGSYWYQGKWTSTGNNQATAKTLTSANITTPAYATKAVLRAYYKRDYGAAVDSSSISVEVTGVAGSPTTLYTIANPVTGVTDATWQGPVTTATAFSLAASTTYTVVIKWDSSADSGEVGGGSVDAVYLNISPGSLTATANATVPKDVDLSWLNAAVVSGPGLHGTNPYKIYRDTTSNPATRTFLANDTASPYTNTTTTGNTTYYYAVTNVDTNSLESPYSPEVSILTKPGTPGTPTFSGVTQTSITVNWTAPTGGATSYKVERAPDVGGAPGTWAEKATGVTSPWTDNTVACSTYWYRVRGTNASGDGAYSANASQTTSACPPAVVSGPTATATATATHVDNPFHLNAVFNAQGFAISTCGYSLNNGGSWTDNPSFVSGSGATTNCDADPTCTDGTAMTILMRATNPGGTTNTGTISRTCDAVAPTNGTLTVTPGAMNFLTWSGISDAGSGLKTTGTYTVRWVQSATSPANCTANNLLGTYDIGTTTATHSGLTDGLQYSYLICATDQVNNQNAGATATVTADLSKISYCGGCHSYKATFADGTARNTPTGLFAGSHSKHVVQYSKVCSVCHVVPATETADDFKHRNSNIQMKAGEKAIDGGYYDKNNNSAYDAGVDDTFAQTNAPSLQTCRNVYCHSIGTGGTSESGDIRTVAANTSTAWAGTTVCNSCHGTGVSTGAPDYENLKKVPTAAASTIWLTPTNVYASDNNNATYDATRAATPVLGADYIQITGFGFTVTDVPDTVTVNDITVVIEGNGQSATLANRQIMVRMVKAGVLTGTAKTATLNQTTDTEIVLGGNEDKWVATWNPSDIRTTNFGVAITDNDQTNDALNPDFRIDKVKIIVHTTDAPKSNSHPDHTATCTCSTCHNTVVSSGNSPITGYSQHVDKTYDVSGTNFSSYAYDVAGGKCSGVASTCHPPAYAIAQWGVTDIDCPTCHNAATDYGDGPPTRRAMVGEFKSIWSHKRSTSGGVPANTVITKYDCCVCHMEGDPATGSTTTSHKNNLLEFRDPDTGSTIEGVNFSGTPGSYTPSGSATSATVFRRETGSNDLSVATGDAFAVAVMVNLCLKCHDSDLSAGAGNGGAKSTSARVPGGTATNPFNVTGVTVVDVYKHFNTANASYHPIRGKQNNSYCNNSTMITPWNYAKTPPSNAIYGYLMTCWDCHDSSSTARVIGGAVASVTAHGNAVTLRALYDFPAAGATGYTKLCVVCHKQTVYWGTTVHSATSAGGPGVSALNTPNDSAYEGTYHPVTREENRGCTVCHGTDLEGGGVGVPATRPTRAENAHGFDTVADGTSTTFGTGGSRPFSFMRCTNNMSVWNTGTCADANGVKMCGYGKNYTYTPGGMY